MWMSCGCNGTRTQLTTKQLQRPTICFLTSNTSAHPDSRLYSGSLLKTPCSVSELRQKGHFPTGFPTTQRALPTYALEACTFSPLLLPQMAHLLINAHRDAAAAGGLSRTIILPAQRGICRIPSHLAPNFCSPLPHQSQLKVVTTCQASQLKLLRALWLGMPSLP